MAAKAKETEEEMQFRKQMEACESVFSSATTSSLPEGTDYHVRIRFSIMHALQTTAKQC